MKHARARRRVLFVVNTAHAPGDPGNGSNRYRCHHPAEALRAQGIRASVMPLMHVDSDAIAAHDAVLVLRPQWNRKLARLLELCNAHGVPAGCDFDDLLFDPQHAEASPRVLNGFAGQRATQSEFRSHQRALLSFDRITVSTEALATAVRSVHPIAQVAVVPNGLSAHWLHSAEAIAAIPTKSPPELMTYLPGTRSHDHDFALIAPALERIMLRQPALKLRIVGPIEFQPAGLPMARVERIAHVPYYALPMHLAAGVISLAPLTDNVFNGAKSRVKAIESLAFGTPLVATPNGDLPTQIPGIEVATTPEQWDTAIERAIEAGRDPSHRANIWSQAREQFCASHSLQSLMSCLFADTSATDVRKAA